MASIFITYRRSDSSSATGRIADRLQSEFGSDKIFYDITAIPLGVDFRTFISNQLDKTEVFLVVIGDNWLETKDAEGNRRLDNPDDWVRIEVSAALARENIPVIPVMVGKASAPPPMEELPGELADLSARNGIVLRSDATFEGQIQKLIAYIENLNLETIVDESGETTQLLVGNDKDKVIMRTKPLKNADKNSIRFSLSTAHDVKWWKGIKVFDKRGMISRLTTQDDDHGPKQSPPIDISDFGDEIKIEFHKAKILGKKFRVDTIKIPTSQMKRTEIAFTWLTDNP
ncbi:toll/interleukin-1 receptor domain-containing protein [Muriicola sp. Z0-33]|uniref:toll/interleukin-1 receptor domain-containing protein n=1 Tax=Muriicola sp. Z0-33 TaxID=2816957 RepID=UPI0022371906|nr:toll/interleukin-1 receptor domain-containing protein [Muriicola sp. Z0-33]MCW5516036.1 toll/interleukin-1 receptor domain-containing protein [Muriicola sp. Z0-33]